MKAMDLALAAVIASTYALLVYLLPFISFLVFQVRVADALLPLSILLGWPAVVGVTLGCAVANLMAPWGIPFLVAVDACLGSMANFVASYVAMRIGNISKLESPVRFQLACIIANLIVTFIVGSYVPLLVNWAFGEIIPIWIGWSGVFLGELVAINILGYSLVLALQRLKIKHRR